MPRGKSTTILIDPKQFTDEQWSELFYASKLIPPADSRRPQDQRWQAESFKATVQDVQDAIVSVNNKAESVRNGDLGESDQDVDCEDWADTLESVGSLLSDLVEASK